MSKHFSVFTVTSDPEHDGAKRLRRSAEYWGWDLRWHIRKEGWERKTYRAETLGQLEFFLHEEPDFALYLDAWDTIFCGPPQELLPQLQRGVLSFCGDTVLSGWSDKPWAARLVPEAFPTGFTFGFPYVNSGVVWGDTAVWRELAADYLQNYREDLINQDYFNMRYAFEVGMGRQRLLVDSRAKVALNIMDAQARFAIRQPNDRLLYKPFYSTPLIIHSPGTGVTQPLAPMPNWMVEAFCA